MARCKSCGKVNRDGAHFCQDCGNSFDGPATPASGGPTGKDRGRAGERAGSGKAVAVAAVAAAAAKLAAATALWFGFGHLMDYLIYASIAGGAKA